MRVFRPYSIGNAHDLIVEAIMTRGVRDPLVTEDNEVTIEYPFPTNITLTTPRADPICSKNSSKGPRFLEKYAQDLLNGSDGEFVYDYHGQLFHYDGTLDQIDECVKILKRNPTSRRAQAITWQPEKHLGAREPPCLQRVQFLVRDGKLNTYVEFRSNDMLSAADGNMYALTGLQKSVADQLGVVPGWYSHTSVSAHIYYVRDAHDLKPFIENLGIKDSCVVKVPGVHY